MRVRLQPEIGNVMSAGRLSRLRDRVIQICFLKQSFLKPGAMCSSFLFV